MSNQFPYPRHSQSPSTPSFSARSTSTYRTRRLLRTYGPPFAAFTLLLWLLIYLFSGSSITSNGSSKPPPGTPPIVIVTTLAPHLSEAHRATIIENRSHYASLHGYTTFFPNTTSYDLMEKTPPSWSTIPALRHAMTTHPHSTWLWYLSSSALIMTPSAPIHATILPPRRLEALLIPDKPVVPPDSVIKTFPRIRGERVDFILTQDKEGLAGDSLLIKTGEWAKFFLDAWFDPLYRSYNFQKAEGHALEHLVQWHGTILAKMVLIPQRYLNSYTKQATASTPDGLYQEGDFIANCHGCDRDPTRNCEQEMAPLISRWRELRDQQR